MNDLESGIRLKGESTVIQSSGNSKCKEGLMKKRLSEGANLKIFKRQRGVELRNERCQSLSSSGLIKTGRKNNNLLVIKDDKVEGVKI